MNITGRQQKMDEATQTIRHILHVSGIITSSKQVGSVGGKILPRMQKQNLL